MDKFCFWTNKSIKLTWQRLKQLSQEGGGSQKAAFSSEINPRQKLLIDRVNESMSEILYIYSSKNFKIMHHWQQTDM